MSSFPRSFLIGALLVPALAAALDPRCAECTLIRESIVQKSARMKALEEILRKNNEYLARHPNLSSSVNIKVKSNIVMASLKIETLQNEITFGESGLREKNCSDCVEVKN
jgi:hypothetical protein